MEIVRMTDGFGQVRQIGRRVDDTLYLVRERKKHLFRKLNAWAIDADVLDLRDDINIYILLDVETGKEYITTRKLLRTKGERIQYEGHGEQYALSLEFWKTYEVSL